MMVPALTSIFVKSSHVIIQKNYILHIQTQDNQVRYKVSDQMQKKIPHILIAIFALSGLLYYSANAQEGPNETPEKEIKELSSHPELN